jgi:hypothetical protein
MLFVRQINGSFQVWAHPLFELVHNKTLLQFDYNYEF